MKRLLIQLVVVVSVVALAGAVAVAWHLWPRKQRFYTDAGVIKTPEDVAVVREILWTPPLPLSERLNTGADDYEPQLSADGRALFLVRGRAGQNADIYHCLRSREGWSDAEPLAAVNTEYDELGPELSADGRSLYFYSDRPGGLGGYDLWVSRLGERGWRPATNLGPRANSQYNDYGPALSPDGASLYFSSNRPRPDDPIQPVPHAWPATLREEKNQRDYDLYLSPITDGGVGQAAALTGLNTEFSEGSPAVSPYGDFLYFTSNRPGGRGKFDLFRSRRLNGDYLPATNLGATINSAGNELDPDLSLGGYALHFSSDRTAEARLSLTDDTEPTPDLTGEQPADYNLYFATSREVFRKIESQHASINWAGFWQQISPDLLGALLALLLILLLLALLRDFRQRKMSLLARCLLASLLVHLLLMLLLNVVEVTTSLANAMRGRGKIQVALAAHAVADEIAGQIRGELTHVDAPEPEVLAHLKAEAFEAVVPMNDTAQLTIEPTSVVLDDHPELPPIAQDAPVSTENAVLLSAREELAVPDEALSSMELALPGETRPIDIDEARTPVDPKPATAERARASTKSYATTQPASPATEDVIEPARAEWAASDTTPSRLARVDGPRDAVTASSPTSPLLKTTPLSDVAHVVLSGLSLPNNESSLPVDADEAAPTVAFAATERARAAVASRPFETAQPELSATVVQVTPATGEHELVEDRPAVWEQELPPNSATPVAVAASPTSMDPAETPIPRLNDITLPPVGGTTAEAEPGDSMMARLQATESARVRADTVLMPSDDSETSTADGGWVILPPARPPGIAEEAGGVFAPSIAPDSSAADNVPSTSVAPHNAVSVVASPLPLELGIPLDLGPPGTQEAPSDAFGTIRGRILDAVSGEALRDATVRLVLPDEETVTATTDEAGLYELAAPEVPDFFALSASLAEYIPVTANLSAAMLSDRPLTVHFELTPQTDYIVALEEEPDVHHLGNDQFVGRINSQFQKDSEGRIFRATFEVGRGQWSPHYGRADVWLMAKGVQCPHQIRINGHLLRNRLDHSPHDGSFGEFTARFDPEWLVAGTNTVKITAKSCRGDLDDFEFVNLQIRLLP